jgi:hypothetical protein
VQTVIFLLIQEITEIEGALRGGLDLLTSAEAADGAAAAAGNATVAGSVGGDGLAGEAAADPTAAVNGEPKPFTLRDAEAAARSSGNGSGGGGLLAASDSLLGGASPSPPPSAALRPAKAGAPERAVDIEARDAAAYTATVLAALERNLQDSLKVQPEDGAAAAVG